MMSLYSMFAIGAFVLLGIFKLCGMSTGKSFALAGLAFVLVAGITTLVLIVGGDKPTPGAQTFTPEEVANPTAEDSPRR